MKTIQSILLGLVCIAMLSCGGKQKKDNAPPRKDTDTAAEANKSAAEDKKVNDAKKQIRAWLNSDVIAKVAELGKQTGKDIGARLAASPEVTKGAKDLTGAILKDGNIKPKLDAIEDKATSGFSKKITLGWKALTGGGIDKFKAKVGADAQRVGTEVLGTHIQNVVLKDPRFLELMKDFSPIIKIQGQMAAVALQENLSQKVSSLILSISLRIAASSGSEAMAARVDEWLSECEDDATARTESLMEDLKNLKSIQDALKGLALDVLKHERTKKELVQMFNKLLDNSEVNAGLTAVYEAAAFEKGDDEIKKAMEKVLAVPAVDAELFATLRNLATAEGASDIIGKHLKTISDDPKLALLIEDFIISILETCGDPSKM
jgi:hypothetical protein